MYSKEFKEGAVRLSVESGKTVREVAQELGISDVTLAKWRSASGVSTPRGDAHQLREAKKELEELKRRVKTLEKEKRVVEVEREILKNRRRPCGPPQFTRNTLLRKMTMVQAVAVCFLEA